MSSSSTLSSTFSEEEEEDDTDEYISTLSSIFCEEDKGVEKFLCFIALHLEQLVENNEMHILYTRQQRTEREIFDCLEVPKVSLHRYFMLLAEDMDYCSPSCYLVAYISLIRFCRNDGLLLDSLNVHYLMLVCIVVAVKFWEDECYTNSIFADMGGVSVEDLNKMEREVLSVINFDLFVTLEEFMFFCDNLQILMDAECLSPCPHYLRYVFFCDDVDAPTLI